MSSYGLMTDVIIGDANYQVDGVSMTEPFIQLEHINAGATPIANRPALIICHGRNDDYGFITTEGKMQPVVDSLIQSSEPWLIMSIRAGGTTAWGNDTAIAAVNAAVTYLLNLGVTAANMYGMGVSMGNLAIMNAQLEHDLFTRTVGIIPIISLTEIRNANTGSAQADIDAAYGGTYVPATEQAAHSPAYYLDTGALDLGCPWLGFYAPLDTWEPAANYTDLAAASSNVDVHDLGNNYGHGWDAVQSVTADELNAWLLAGTLPS